jgi:hypothetical protein
VYTDRASAAVSTVDASGVVTSAIMARHNPRTLAVNRRATCESTIPIRRKETRMKPVVHAVVATLVVAGLHGALGIAHADVPTAGHVAACNQEARDGVKGPAASPTSKDEAGADAARKARAETPSPDPQIDGMDAEGAKNAAYRAVYRVCMRKSGF